MTRAVLVATLALASVACQTKRQKAKTQDAGQRVEVKPQVQQPPRAPQIKPPLPVAKPPPDAETLTGVEGAPTAVIYVKRLTPGTGANPQRNDTVSINFTGWRTTGETFLSTTVRKRPVQQSLARLAPGFAAAVVSMKKGERAMMWIPPELGYMGPPATTPETTVYEVELVEIEAGPPTPPDVAGPPPGSRKTASGVFYERVRQGNGKDKPKFHDLVQIDFSAWMATGRLVDSTRVTKQPKQTFVFREPVGIEEVLRTMTVGEIVRLWLPENQIEVMPPLAKGTLCYEIELLSVSAMTPPPPVPKDVAAPPGDAKKTPKGVFYKELKAGTGTVLPKGTDRVKVEYTGWTTNGRLFDSSVVRNEPAVMGVDKTLPGLGEALTTLVVGAKSRFWIPVELAYNNEPGAPKGMLVFDLEMLEILPPAPKKSP